MRKRRVVGVLAGVLGVLVAMTGVTGASAARAGAGKRVYNAMQIIFSPNALTSPLNNERLLGAGLFDDNELVVSGQLGVFYGRITNNSNGVYQCWAAHKDGDSGGPAIWHVPGSAYPSAQNKFRAAGPWAGITKAVVAGVPPFVYTSSANILADLRTRDAAHPGVYGAGFHVTDNP